MARIRLIAPTVVLLALLFGLYTMFGSRSPSALAVPNQQSDKPVIKNPEASRVLSPPAKSIFSPTEQHSIARKPKYAITSSVQTSSFTAMAVMLGYSIQKHNDLKAMDAELILLVRDDGPDAVTAANKTRLEKAGWKIRVAQDLEFEGVDTSQIRAHHRHNLNKLHLWSWTEYEKILFVDADVVCKGSVAELWSMPGDFAAAPDVWFDILVDTRFNSGVILFTPSMETFHNMISKVPDPKYHSPNDADQAFLNAYYKFRFFGLPFKYNFNLVMYQYHRETWDDLWDEAVFIHFTMHKPRDTEHCHKGCNEWEPLEWYGQYFKEMLAFHGWEKELPVIA